jgi:hypothetical protein
MKETGNEGAEEGAKRPHVTSEASGVVVSLDSRRTKKKLEDNYEKVQNDIAWFERLQREHAEKEQKLKEERAKENKKVLRSYRIR